MSGVVALRSLGEQTFTAALASARESGTAAFGLHPRTETVLTFAGSLGTLKSSFHNRLPFRERLR
jgi:hypothetical protein